MKLSEILETVDVDQARIKKGLNAQDVVAEYLADEYGEDWELTAKAGRNQKSPDIIGDLHGHRTQFEVKLRDKPTDPVTLYDTMIPRGGRDPVLDAFARAETNGEAKTYTEFVDKRREIDPSRGWPGDHPTVPKTGGMSFSSTNPKTIQVIRRRLMDQLKANNDDYFVIVTGNTTTVDIYDVGSTHPEIQAPRIPNIRRIVVKTYGGGRVSDKTGLYNARITVKAVFGK